MSITDRPLRTHFDSQPDLTALTGGGNSARVNFHRTRLVLPTMPLVEMLVCRVGSCRGLHFTPVLYSTGEVVLQQLARESQVQPVQHPNESNGRVCMWLAQDSMRAA